MRVYLENNEAHGTMHGKIFHAIQQNKGKVSNGYTRYFDIRIIKL